MKRLSDSDNDSVADLEHGVVGAEAKRKSSGRGFLGIGGRKSPSSKVGKVFGNDVPLYDIESKSPVGSSSRSISSRGTDISEVSDEKRRPSDGPERKQDV